MTRSNRNAFTLVELLVVVGIISVLISLLLPALNKAREAAKTVSCLSTLRQFGQASANYSAENKGYLHPCYYGGQSLATPPASSSSLPEILSRYIPRTTQKNRAIWVCPNAYIESTNQYPLTYAANQGVHVNYTYDNAINNYAPIAWIDRSGKKHSSLKRVSQIRRPSEIVSIADASQSSGAWTTAGWLDWTSSNISEMYNPAVGDLPINQLAGWSWTNLDTGNYHMRYRHNSNRLGNALFVDGHADSFPFATPARPKGGLKMRNFATGY
jgi:prepilin-type N-terminal cleavage/methylation domain-containing protein/prepilin-type processing-associated H-X9-DG protein